MKSFALKMASVALAAALLASCGSNGKPQAIPADAEVEAKVESVLKGMTL